MAMSVAENAPVTERAPRSLQHQLVLGSFLGALFVLAGIWVVLAGIPEFFHRIVPLVELTKSETNREGNDFLAAALILMASTAAAGGLAYLGYRLIQNYTTRGVRAGIFFAAVMLLVSLWIGEALGNRFDQARLGVMGMALTGGVTLALLAGTVFLFLQPGWARFMGTVEDQGWFHGTGYKPSQGVRVRRGTILAILALGLCGIITLIQHRAFGGERPDLGLPTNDWYWQVPFASGSERVSAKELADKLASKSDTEKKSAELLYKQLVGKDAPAEPDERVRLLRRAFGDRDEGSIGELRYFPLLFKIHMIVPTLMGIILLWFAWRLVNVPTFADFLIATEAEMNKVSWTTRRRLVQDTIVVLVTVFLMASFLFIMDIVWVRILTHPWIGVLYYNPKEAVQKQQEKSQW